MYTKNDLIQSGNSTIVININNIKWTEYSSQSYWFELKKSSKWDCVMHFVKYCAKAWKVVQETEIMSLPPTRYYFLPWSGTEPFVMVHCDFEDVTHRLHCVNHITAIVTVSHTRNTPISVLEFVNYVKLQFKSPFSWIITRPLLK